MAFDMRHSNADHFQLEKTNLKIFADGADLDAMKALAQKKWISGFTTNPALMLKEKVSSYSEFWEKVKRYLQGKSISLEVFADEPKAMIDQALILKSWGENIVVKIPITNTEGVFSGPVIKELQAMGVPLNITAIFTTKQVEELLKYLDPDQPIIISVFAGRIADTGRDPLVIMGAINHSLIQDAPKAQLLWASCREVYNILQAEQCGCQIITVTADILKKLNLLGMDLTEYSSKTVKEFHDAGLSAGMTLLPQEALVSKMKTGRP
jgi:transaldolase